MKLYAITDEDLANLKRVATRLYTEDRIDGDEMRNLAHAITAIVKVSEQIEIPEPGP